MRKIELLWDLKNLDKSNVLIGRAEISTRSEVQGSFKVIVEIELDHPTSITFSNDGKNLPQMSDIEMHTLKVMISSYISGYSRVPCTFAWVQ